ncbi:F0F1 ATP synthase subunit alpha [Microgenomates group bacterium RBG_16_45_19]|nr:MAG: F0F1 ATP synthase subunit alpha [Microgenomates group bacterium RBG_16_45_19]
MPSPKLIDQLTQSLKVAPSKPTFTQAGTIIRVGDGIALISGLSEARMSELLLFPGGVRGLVLNLNQDSIGVVILGSDLHLKAGDSVWHTDQQLSIPASKQLLGRVITPLGDPLDGGDPIVPDQIMPLERLAPGVIDRQPVSEPLQTGIKAIDSMIPIGQGQRELIIGDRSTGKSAIVLTTMINQQAENVICIYVAIGQKRSFVAQTIDTLKRFNAMPYSIIVSASASDPAPLQYLAPYAGCAIGEYFAQKGLHALVIYDDLSKHAWAYREMSLLLRRPSGREAYPGDVFYLHSRLLERAVKYSTKQGGGSLTALPIIETQAGDISAYIPTNVISITDGQIFLDTDMFNAGQRPAVNLGISVSRVGGAAQIKAMKQVVGSLKIDMAQFRELAAFAQFSSDLDPQTRSQLERGQRITEILKQGWDEPTPVEDQVAVFHAAATGLIDQVQINLVKTWETKYLAFLHHHHADLLKTIHSQKTLSPALLTALKQASDAFLKQNPELLITPD